MLSIGITTFKHRFETYFKPLLQTIKEYDKDIEVIVAINGEHNEQFDDEYRKDIMQYISTHRNTYPITFPNFRGLAKLWNSIIIHSSNENILLLNDDVTMTDPEKFFNMIKHPIQLTTSYKINGSWSHVFLKKSEVTEVGFFDERLLGIGEEDGDFEWRYNRRYNRPFFTGSIYGIVNHVDMSHAPTNIQAGASGKYSKFNREVLFNEIYSIDPINGLSYGMISEKLTEGKREKQYPYEDYYLKNKGRL